MAAQGGNPVAASSPLVLFGSQTGNAQVRAALLPSLPRIDLQPLRRR